MIIFFGQQSFYIALSMPCFIMFLYIDIRALWIKLWCKGICYDIIALQVQVFLIREQISTLYSRSYLFTKTCMNSHNTFQAPEF